MNTQGAFSPSSTNETSTSMPGRRHKGRRLSPKPVSEDLSKGIGVEKVEAVQIYIGLGHVSELALLGVGV